MTHPTAEAIPAGREARAVPETRPVPAGAAGARSSRVFLPAAATGALLWASFFPLALGLLAWVALVPFCLLVFARASGGRLFLASLVGGLVFFVPALQWVRVAHPMMYLAWVGLALLCALYFPLALFLTRRLVLRGVLPLVAALPVVWTVLEFVRGTFLGGFAWYFLAHSQHDFLPVIQVADLTGVYGISFAVALVNAFLASAVLRSGAVRRFLRTDPAAPVPGERGLRLAAVGTTLLLALVLGYGVYRLEHEPFEAGPRVALIQGNIPQAVRNARNDADQEEARKAVGNMYKHHTDLANTAALRRPPPELIIWPETSYPWTWVMRAPDAGGAQTEEEAAAWGALEGEVRKDFAGMARAWRAYVLLGLNSLESRPGGKTVKYNTALLIAPSGEPVDVYHKMHRVPFGEYVPFKETLPFMRWFTPYDYEYGIEAGGSWTRFPVEDDGRTYHFGVLICYEDSDPTLARSYVPWNEPDATEAAERPVDFLVNIPNDGWFKGTSEHEEHLAISRFRAVESRRALVRAVNMGISAVIDGDGRVVALPGQTWADSKKREAVVIADVPIDRRRSVYALLGDWLPAACGLVLAGGLIAGYRRR